MTRLWCSTEVAEQGGPAGVCGFCWQAVGRTGVLDVAGKREGFIRQCATTLGKQIHFDSHLFVSLRDLDGPGLFLHSEGVDPTSHSRYLRHWHLDPCFPTIDRMISDRVASVRSIIDSCPRQHETYYHNFMQPEGYSDFLEAVIVTRGRPRGAFTFIRNHGVFSDQEVNLLRAWWDLIELTADDLFLLQNEVSAAHYVPKRFDFTRREEDIVVLIRDGKSNKEIARDLSIGLPTVKTHLIHIFQKTGVNNRTALLNAVYSI